MVKVKLLGTYVGLSLHNWFPMTEAYGLPWIIYFYRGL